MDSTFIPYKNNIESTFNEFTCNFMIPSSEKLFQVPKSSGIRGKWLKASFEWNNFITNNQAQRSKGQLESTLPSLIHYFIHFLNKFIKHRLCTSMLFWVLWEAGTRTGLNVQEMYWGNTYDRSLGGCQERLGEQSDHDAGLMLREEEREGRKQV